MIKWKYKTRELLSDVLLLEVPYFDFFDRNDRLIFTLRCFKGQEEVKEILEILSDYLLLEDYLEKNYFNKSNIKSLYIEVLIMKLKKYIRH